MEPVDIHRESLLDARVPSAAASAKFARVLMVAKYSVGKDELTEETEKLAADNGYTGAFLFFDGSTYSKVVLITLEADIFGLQRFMTGPVATAMLADVRVVSLSDDLSARAWPVFAVVSITAAVSSTELMEASEVRSAIGGLMINTARLGRLLKGSEGAGMDEIAEMVRSAPHEMHPQVTLLLSVLGQDDACYTLEQYVSTYFAPAKLNIASEKVWPAQELRLQY